MQEGPTLFTDSWTREATLLVETTQSEMRDKERISYSVPLVMVQRAIVTTCRTKQKQHVK